MSRWLVSNYERGYDASTNALESSAGNLQSYSMTQDPFYASSALAIRIREWSSTILCLRVQRGGAAESRHRY